MDLRHLRYFVAVAEELHFGRAAEKLHISQPPLSHQIRDLERDLGVELFHRTRHVVVLTEAGRLFLAEARHVLSDAEHAVGVAQKAARGEIGRLSVGFGPAPENGVLQRVLAMFLSRHPNVSLDLRHLYTTEQIESLASRQIHVALPLLPITHKDVVAESIGSERLVVAFPAEHPLASRNRLDLADLRNERFVRVSPERGRAYCELVTRSCEETGFNPEVTHEADDVIAVLGFVAAGLGVSILPESLRNVRADGIAFRPLHHGPSVEIGLAYRRDESSRILLSFLEVAREIGRQTRLALMPKAANA